MHLCIAYKKVLMEKRDKETERLFRRVKLPGNQVICLSADSLFTQEKVFRYCTQDTVGSYYKLTGDLNLLLICCSLLTQCGW